MEADVRKITLELLNKRKIEIKISLSIKKDIDSISRLNEELKLINKTIRYINNIEGE